MGFKKDFIFGAATAAYQIEGAANEDGRGESIWDVYSHQDGKIFDNHTGDVTCDHYHRFKDDVKIMKKLGIKAYRFSISWTRLIPNGVGEINEAGVKFYSDLIDELVKNDIEPYITLFHWDYPYSLYKKGGWLNPESVKWFADYASVIADLFSDKVTHFITFNEPQCFIGLGFLDGIHAPGVKAPYRDTFEMAHNVLKAHGAAVIAMRQVAKQAIKIGYAPTCTPVCPKTESLEDIKAAKSIMFSCPPVERWAGGITWWSDPIVLGRYPEDGLKKYAKYLPKITEDDMRLIHQPIDFYCQNIYQGLTAANVNSEAELVERKVGYEKTSMNWAVTPESLRWGAKFLYERYNLPFYISENGMAGQDSISADGKIYDVYRINFLERYIKQYEKAAEEGVDACGYFQWSLMDNFEWTCGYSERFGLVYIDYLTQQRIIKQSGYWYRDLIAKFNSSIN